jgi:PKD repeat protein
MKSNFPLVAIVIALLLGSGCSKDNSEGPFMALFSFSVNGFVTNFSNFTDFRNYTGPYAEYTWDFGDGDSSIAASPSHTYGSIGKYLVTLTATKSGQTSTFSDSVTITGPKINIDGDFDDWEHIDFTYTSDKADAILKSVKVFQFGRDINFYLEGSSEMDFSEVQIFFNTDDNSSTGFQVSGFPMGSGAEYNFYGEGLGVYTEVNQHQGGPNDDDWDNIFYFDASDDETSSDGGPSFSSVVGLSNGNKAIEFSFPKALLGGVSGSISFAIYDDNTNGTLPTSGEASSKFLKVEF